MPAGNLARSQTRALLWEEARVGGVIAGFFALVGLLMLVLVRLIFDPEFAGRNEDLPYVVGLWIPVAIAFLLVLNPDHAGHLTGGFSKRILRLPVATTRAVAVSLLCRTSFLIAASTVLTGICSYLSDGKPGYGVIFLVAIIYVIAQLFDWLRGPVSGLATLAALAAALLIASFVIAPKSIVHPASRALDTAADSPAFIAMIAVASLAAAYALALVAVRADRTGLRFGFPEVWQWNLPFSRARQRVHPPFRSPLAAQIWFELRRAKGTLPITACSAFVLFVLVIWLAFSEDRDTGPLVEVLRVAAGWPIFIALIVGAVVHSTTTTLVGSRRGTRPPGYEYLQPLSDAHFAAARIAAGLIMLLPTLGVALAVHYGVAAPRIAFDVLPDALANGYGSLREVLWVFVGRGLFIGLFAWAVLAVGTRLFRRVIGLALAVLVPLALSDYFFDSRFLDALHANFFTGDRQDISTPIVLGAIILTLACTTVAWRAGLISRRTIVTWSVAWLLVAWLLRYVLVMSFAPHRPDTAQHALAIPIALGYSAAVPLVFLAFLFDVARRRRATRAPQILAQRRIASEWPRSQTRIAALALLVMAIGWLGWPAKPAYVNYFDLKGYPATLKELDDAYIAPAPAENDALAYLAAADRRDQLDQEFQSLVAQAGNALLKPPSGTRVPGMGDEYYARIFEVLYVVGRNRLERKEKLSNRGWVATQLYWSRVSSQIVPTVQEIGRNDTTDSRYPLNMEDGYAVLLPHLALSRALARELAVDSLYWTISARPDKATDSVLAGFSISDSLTNEPLLISQLVRIAIIGINVSSIESILNRSVPTEAELLRLQRACEAAYPVPATGLSLDRSVVAEAIMVADAPFLTSGVSFPDNLETGLRRRPPLALALPHEIAFPRAATSIIATAELEETIRFASKTRRESLAADSALEADDYARQVRLVAPVVNIMWPAIRNTYDAERRARTTLQIAQVAIAVERFRLANDRLPNELNELVPDFIPEVPEDYFAGPGIPLKYRTRDSGKFVVYSVGRDGEDDSGEEMENWWQEGDLTFTVATLATRTGPQVVPD